jgi:MFS transporter, PPP family, 3-phenylpropionic acid transporter
MRGTFPLRAFYVASFAVGGMYLPYLPQWLQGRGIRGVELGMIAAAAPAMNVLAPTAFGVAADALALRGGLLQVTAGGALLAFGSLSLAVAWHVPLGFGALFLAALLIALFRSPMTVILDVVALERAPAVGTTYGRLRLWGSLGFLGSALAAGCWMDPRDALAFPALCTTALAASFVGSFWLPRRAEIPDPADGRSVLRALGERDFRWFLAAVFLGQCGHVAYDVGFSLHLADLGVPRAWIGVAWALGTGAEVVLMAWSGPMLRRFAASTLLAVALAGAALRWGLLAAVRSPPWLFVLQPLHAVSFGLTWLAAVTYASRRFPARLLGTAQGLFATAMGLGSAAGMVLWSGVYQRSGGAFMFAGAACFAVCASALAVALDRRVRAPVRSDSAGEAIKHVSDGKRWRAHRAEDGP